MKNGGEADERRSLIANDAEDPNSASNEPRKKNAWKLCGKQCPACLVPRKRNNDTHRAVEEQDLPINSGVDANDRTKENMWAGEVDRDYGEFYKKMSLNEEKAATEVIMFYNFWNIWRKLMYAVTIVFFDDMFRLQAYTQIVTSGIMTVYIMNYWPCARYVDNVSKLVNELTFISMLVNCAYLKEMSASVSSFDPGASPASAGSNAGNFMIVLISGNLIFHGLRMIHNSIQAAKTIKARRQ